MCGGNGVVCAEFLVEGNTYRYIMDEKQKFLLWQKEKIYWYTLI